MNTSDFVNLSIVVSLVSCSRVRILYATVVALVSCCVAILLDGLILPDTDTTI